MGLLWAFYKGFVVKLLGKPQFLASLLYIRYYPYFGEILPSICLCIPQEEPSNGFLKGVYSVFSCLKQCCCGLSSLPADIAQSLDNYVTVHSFKSLGNDISLDSAATIHSSQSLDNDITVHSLKSLGNDISLDRAASIDSSQSLGKDISVHSPQSLGKDISLDSAASIDSSQSLGNDFQSIAHSH